MNKGYLALICISLSLPAAGQIQTTEIPLNPPQCEWMSERLPPFDAHRIILSATKFHVAKDEYETDVAYQSRIENIIQKIAPTGRAWGSASIFSGLGKYDPATQSIVYRDFELAEPLDMTLLYGDGNQRVVYAATSNRRDKNYGSYVGENAFGATAKVHVSESNRDEVGFFQTNRDLRNGVMNAELRISIAPDRARLARSHLILTIGGHLAPPYIVEDDDGITPTLDAPVSMLTHKRILIVSPACGAISDGQTGEVFATFLMPPL